MVAVAADNYLGANCVSRNHAPAYASVSAQNDHSTVDLQLTCPIDRDSANSFDCVKVHYNDQHDGDSVQCRLIYGDVSTGSLTWGSYQSSSYSGTGRGTFTFTATAGTGAWLSVDCIVPDKDVGFSEVSGYTYTSATSC
jgi:hypothetical protein